MERKVIFRDRQELQAADLTNVENYTDEALQHIITDALTAERQIVGLQVIAKSATEIEINPGRLWVGDSGKIYSLDSKQTISIFSYLPVQDKKWLCISVYGQEVDVDNQPRDFLIDLQTGQTEPRAVAMERKREIVSHITAGLESPDPQKPEPPTGYTIIAYVLLGTAGIEDIQLAENKRLMRLFDVNERVKDMEGWKAIAQPALSTLTSDVAALAERMNSIRGFDMIYSLAADMAILKEKENLPDTYSYYGADHYLDNDESEIGDQEYYANVDEGVRFPWAGQNQSQIALFNPIESQVRQYSGFILPAFNEELRITTRGFAGDIPISQYQHQTYQLKQGTISRTEIKYGPTRTVCTNNDWWRSGQYDPINRIFVRNGETYEVEWDEMRGPRATTSLPVFVRIRQFWHTTIVIPYWYGVTTTHNINGSQIAQTFLNAQNSWLTKVGLYFTAKDTQGIVHLHLCETHNGVPNLKRCIGRASVNPADIKIHPVQTVFEFTRPVYLAAGTRYALVITTAGNHKLAIVSGAQYTQGTMFYSMDGEYYQGDFTKDLMMDFYYAKFVNPYIQVNLEPLSLSGGIADIFIHAGMIVPQTTSLHFEYQHMGLWRRIEPATGAILLGLPAMLPLRMVLSGTTDIMPAIELVGSIVRVSRPATTFKHISTLRTLPQAKKDFNVQLLLEGWDSSKHACTVKLKSGTTTYNPVSVVDTVVADDSIRRVATFDTTSNISNYRIIIEGATTTALNCFHVAERIDIAL